MHRNNQHDDIVTVARKIYERRELILATITRTQRSSQGRLALFVINVLTYLKSKGFTLSDVARNPNAAAYFNKSSVLRPILQAHNMHEPNPNKGHENRQHKSPPRVNVPPYQDPDKEAAPIEYEQEALRFALKFYKGKGLLSIIGAQHIKDDELLKKHIKEYLKIILIKMLKVIKKVSKRLHILKIYKKIMSFKHILMNSLDCGNYTI